jgi:uncharacterized protein YcnI
LESREVKKATWRTGLVAATVAAGTLAVAAPASAHVTVHPTEPTRGARARVDFRVPNESDTESTTELAVHFPEESPISSASVGKLPGWSVEVTYRTLDEPIEGGQGEQISEVVEVITWTADNEDAAIQPGEFLEFPVSLGPLPEVEQLAFPALQTYSDGEVARWIDIPEGDAEAENPAPVLTLAAAAAEEGGEDNGTAASSGEGTEAASSDADSDSGSGAGTWLGLAGLIAGLAGLALGGIAFARTAKLASRTEVTARQST